MQAKVMIARFPGNNHEDPECVTWIINTIREIDRDPRISRLHMFVKSDTPITMVRNEAVSEAQREGVDFLLMIDNDMKPDCRRNEKPFSPFWKSAFDFLFRREVPALICSPYVGPNPHNNIYVFRYTKPNNYDDNDFGLRQYTREEAAVMSGIQWVPAIPTGLVLIDMRLFERGGPNWFEYEWQGDGKQCPTCNQYRPGKRIRKGSTEDVMWSRNVSNLWRGTPGAGCYVNWDSWSIHRKLVDCMPPELPHHNHMGIVIDKALADQNGAIRSDECVQVLGGPVNAAGGVMDPNPGFVDLTGEPEPGPAPVQTLFAGPSDDNGRSRPVFLSRFAEKVREHYPDLLPQGTDDGRI